MCHNLPHPFDSAHLVTFLPAPRCCGTLRKAMNRRHFLSLLPSAALAQQPRRASEAPKAQPQAHPDWHQWHGPNRDNISTETGLLKTWPSGGPKLLWSIRNLGTGYGSLALRGDRIYVQGTVGRDSAVFALNRADGKPVWNAPIGPALDQDRGGGPRGTPTVEGDLLYAISENGDLACIRATDAHVAWHRNMLKDYNGQNPNWHISESPLIDGNNVIATPGGRNGGIVAFDKGSGKEVWAARELTDEAGYASCIVADVGGVRTIMNLMSEAGVGVRANDGKLLWRYEKAANGTANCTTPVYSDNKVFYTSAYGTGGGLLALNPANGGVQTQEVYFSRDMQNHHGGVILHKGHLYGFSNAILTCMEFATGKVAWRDRSVGKGSLTYADGMLFLFSENNVVGLAEATTTGYVEKGRFNIEDQGRPSWAHPVVCGGKLYIRNQGVLNCYSVAGA
jgi:outer membrane protein assembly factor BamB